MSSLTTFFPLIDWMDFEGQILSERLYQVIIVLPSVSPSGATLHNVDITVLLT